MNRMRLDLNCQAQPVATSSNDDAGPMSPPRASAGGRRGVMLHRCNVLSLRPCNVSLRAVRSELPEKCHAINSEGRRGLAMVASVFRQGSLDHRRFQPRRYGRDGFVQCHARR